MRTAGRWPPLMLTNPTPESWEIFCAKAVSAKSSTLESGRLSEARASVRIGASAGLILLTAFRFPRKAVSKINPADAQALWEEIRGAIDGRLNFLLGDVNV